jgi:hypothetical protein
MKILVPVDGSSFGNAALKRPLLACGVLSSLLYIAMNAFVPMRLPPC